MKRISKSLILILVLITSIVCNAQNPQKNCYQGDQKEAKTIPEGVDKTASAEENTSVYVPCDPNEIIGTKGYDALGDTLQWVAATASLPYTIYFENDPEMATAAAQKVEVRHKLHSKADISTFAIGAFGFGSHVFTVEGNRSSYQQRLDLTQDMGIYVDVVAGIDIVAGEAFWILQSIDPATGLPPQGIQQGFLPVNDENHSGEGYVSFTVKPVANACITGDELTASASIVFDVNEAIPTNVWHNTVDALPPTTQLTGAENDNNEVLLEFSGQDDEGGCGIKQYKLYVSDNYGSYSLYDTYPVGTTATYLTEYDHCYRFFCLGEDNVGNVEAMKETADVEYGNYNLSVAASVDPEEGGVVTGGGTYVYQSVATVIAEANPGYEFYQWTNHGVPVSDEATYSFTITEQTELVAHFITVTMLNVVLSLASGWNWFSCYVESSDELLNEIENAIATNNTMALLKDMTNTTMLQNGTWSDSDLVFSNESMYMANVGNATTVTLTAPRATASGHPITLLPGWNWIGFVSNTDMSIKQALSSLVPNNGDLIKNMSSTSSFTGTAWEGTLEILEPGDGYMYHNKGTEAMTLVYPDAAKEVVRSLPAECHWTTNVHDHATNLVMMATLDESQFQMAEGNYEIGAFVDGECRGSARLQSTTNGYVAFLVIHGEAEETISFRLYDVDQAVEMGEAEEQLRYVPNAINGSVEEPVVLHFGSSNVNEVLCEVRVYPNPADDRVVVESHAIQTVKVYNMLGQCLLSKSGGGANQVELHLNGLDAGIYMLRVLLDNGQQTNKRIVKE